MGSGRCRRRYGECSPPPPPLPPRLPPPLLQGVPQAPMCGFSNMACAILNLYGAWAGAGGRGQGKVTGQGRAAREVLEGGGELHRAPPARPPHILP